MNRSLPFWKFYPADYFTETSHLTPEQHGVLLLLLFIAWQRGGPIPNDDAFIKRALESRAAGMHGNRYNRLVPPLLKSFFALDSEGNWRRDSLENDLENARNFSGIQRENAKKRWINDRKNKGIDDAMGKPARASSYAQSQLHKARTTKPNGVLIREDSPEREAWEAYEGGKIACFDSDEPGRPRGFRRATRWPPNWSAKEGGSALFRTIQVEERQ